MKIYGYPGERVDFVSKSGGAGSLMFGDPRHLAEEFFGAPHTCLLYTSPSPRDRG